MRTDALIRHAKVLWRADRLIADIRLRLILTKAGLVLAAGSIGVFGIVMLGIAGYLFLAQEIGPVLAAAAIGAGGLVLAAILMFVALALAPGREEAVALELHAAALDALTTEAKTLEADAAGLINAIRHPLDGALGGLVVPLVGILAKGLRRRESKSDG